jgi:2-(1,2-epoxy-1,2-dihydrophenyl)acetyl-CoA isomerase
MTDALPEDGAGNADGNRGVVIRWDGDVLVVMLNRPAVSNALDAAVLRDLTQAFAIAAQDRCRAVVLCGAGRNFCAGADIAAYRADPAAMQLATAFHPPLRALAALRQPVVAALNGAVAGGGLGFALQADIRIMGRSARLHPAWVKIGLAPDLGASWVLPRLIGPARAFEWLATGDPMDAARAVAIGLAGQVVEDAALIDTAIALAHRLAAQPPRALAFTKQLLRDSYARDLDAQIDEEARVQSVVNADTTRNGAVDAQIAKYAKGRRSDENR